jgi:hypothetical protein
MAEKKSRNTLSNVLFKNGATPDQDDFLSFSLSHFHKEEDGLFLDGDKRVNFSSGIKIGNMTDEEGDTGFLRINDSGDLQIHDGTAFVNIKAEGEGGFGPVGTNSLAFNGLSVGIGTGTDTPAYRLEVEVGKQESPTAADPSNQIRFGNAIISRGAGTQSNSACFSHENFATNNVFAIKQSQQGTLTFTTAAEKPDQRQIRFGIYDPVTQSTFRAITIDADGNVGIGENSPDERLHVNGRVRANCGILNCSDVRFKDNVNTLENSLEILTSLRGVSFEWRKDEFEKMGFVEGQQYGLIAQEVEKVLPEMVQKDQQGYRLIDYSRLAPFMLEAIKQLNDKNQALSKELELMKEQIRQKKED